MKFLPILMTLILIASCGDKRSINPLPIATDTTKLQNDKAVFAEAKPDTISRKIKRFLSKYNFESFKTEVFTGKTMLPSFSGNPFSNDKKYRDFITEGCKQNGINFGGHFTIIQRSCGAMCEHIFIVDRINGKVFTDTKPNDGRYGYLFKKDSRLLIANSNVFQDDSLKYYSDFFGEPELYVWKDNNFVRLQ